MHRQRPGSTLFLPIAFLLAAGLAHAAKPTPLIQPVAGGPLPAIGGATGEAQFDCQTGIIGPPVYSVGYIYPPDDSYYTLIDPSDCECPDTTGVLVSAAHIVLHFEWAFSIPVRVGIVQADLSDEECPIPIPGQYLCPPVDYDLQGPGYGIHDIALPLSADCVATERSFLEITFTEWAYDIPVLILTGSCESCRSYNYYPGDNYDLCTFGFEGNPIMYVDAMCPGTAAAPEAAPSAAALVAMPNPFSASTVLRFQLSQGGPVAVEIFDVGGRCVAKPVDEWLPAGGHTAAWDASKMPSGIYLCRLRTADLRDTQRIQVVR